MNAGALSSIADIAGLPSRHGDSHATVGGAMREAFGALAQAGIETARLDARVLLGHAIGCDWAALLVRHDGVMPLRQVEIFKSLIARRVRREPVAHIVGRREFWSLDFHVSAATLIPRPDSETVVEAVVEINRDRHGELKILDLGTGSGCLLLSLLHEYPNARGIGVDISMPALSVAAANSRSLGVEDRAAFIAGNWDAALDACFDVIVVNPPYVRDEDFDKLSPEVSVFEPREALSGGHDGLDCYRSLVGGLARLLTADGAAFLETGAGQAASVAGLVNRNDLYVIDIKRDLSRIERCVVAGRGGR
ncbi:MAG: peptide chain release factor N(5)-glutamine methyltransferase [Rhodospirillales bacterium]